MSKFKVGDEVTLIRRPSFKIRETGELSKNPPVFGKVYPVADIWQYKESWYIELGGLDVDSGWNEKEFEKVISTPMLYKEIERKTQEV
jgi:hypothetical protein